MLQLNIENWQQNTVFKNTVIILLFQIQHILEEKFFLYLHYEDFKSGKECNFFKYWKLNVHISFYTENTGISKIVDEFLIGAMVFLKSCSDSGKLLYN